MLELGFSAKGIKHRLLKGRLHSVGRGVYAVGRPQLTQRGRWMAAVLRCGDDAVLSHGSAATLWEIAPERPRPLEISVPVPRDPRPPGITVHRRTGLAPEDLSTHFDIPVTSPTRTLLDLALRLPPRQLEAAINEADKHDVIDPESLRSALDVHAGEPGVARLRAVLDRNTFTLTDSELERLLLPIARRAGLAKPLTQRHLNGFKVDFYWPRLGLVVETDGLRYHRTPTQQARDRRRDQAHIAAGLTPLRFTHAQVKYEARHVEAVLAEVARRLGRKRARLTPLSSFAGCRTRRLLGIGLDRRRHGGCLRPGHPQAGRTRRRREARRCRRRP